MVEGPGKRGEIVQICADPECEIHGRPNHRAEQEAAAKLREREWKRQQERQTKARSENVRMLDAVLDALPKALTRDDYEMLVVAAIERLEYEAFDAACERHKIDADEERERDSAAHQLMQKAKGATEASLIRMLVELALLPSGYSSEPMQPNDPLARAALRYGVSLKPKVARKLAKRSVKGKAPRTKPGPKARGAAKKPKEGGAA